MQQFDETMENATLNDRFQELKEMRMIDIEMDIRKNCEEYKTARAKMFEQEEKLKSPLDDDGKKS